MSNEKTNSEPEHVSEQAAAYGMIKRFTGKKIIRTQADRDKMGAPSLPPEPEFVAEILAEAERRKRAKESMGV